MVNYRYLGYGITDENGIAKLDHDAQGNAIEHSYTGVGAGKIDIVASLDDEIDEGSLVSETYEILDCLFLDSGAYATKNTNWFSSTNVNVSTPEGSEDTTVSATSTSAYISNQVITGDFEAIVECKNITGGGIRVGLCNKNNMSFNKAVRVSFSNDSYYYLKFRRENGVWTVSRSTDGVSWTNYSSLDANSLTTEDCYFCIYAQFPSGSTGERALAYKNLMIYPI